MKRTFRNLTPHQMAAIDLTLAGRPNKEIPARIFCAPKTAFAHRYRAFEKLGVDSDRDLFRWYMSELVRIYGDAVPARALTEPSLRCLGTTA